MPWISGVVLRGQLGRHQAEPFIKSTIVLRILEPATRLERVAVTRLAFWLNSDNPKASVSAAIALLDRGRGRAPQAITGESGEGPLGRPSFATFTNHDDPHPRHALEGPALGRATTKRARPLRRAHRSGRG
jgi:hypothetical protein